MQSDARNRRRAAAGQMHPEARGRLRDLGPGSNQRHDRGADERILEDQDNQRLRDRRHRDTAVRRSGGYRATQHADRRHGARFARSGSRTDEPGNAERSRQPESAAVPRPARSGCPRVGQADEDATDGDRCGQTVRRQRKGESRMLPAEKRADGLWGTAGRLPARGSDRRLSDEQRAGAVRRAGRTYVERRQIRSHGGARDRGEPRNGHRTAVASVPDSRSEPGTDIQGQKSLVRLLLPGILRRIKARQLAGQGDDDVRRRNR